MEFNVKPTLVETIKKGGIDTQIIKNVPTKKLMLSLPNRNLQLT
jgi:hypothetical protein